MLIQEYIREQSCMAAVPVGEGMHRHQSVMDADGDFIHLEYRFFYPMRGVAYGICHACRDQVGRYADILFGLAVRSRPTPGPVEHLLVQASNERIAEHGTSLVGKCPNLRGEDVLMLPLIELRGEVDV